jgi:hypothetical protein
MLLLIIERRLTMKGHDDWIEGHASSEQVFYKCPECKTTWEGYAWLEHVVLSAPADESDLCPECRTEGDIV